MDRVFSEKHFSRLIDQLSEDPYRNETFSQENEKRIGANPEVTGKFHKKSSKKQKNSLKALLKDLRERDRKYSVTPSHGEIGLMPKRHHSIDDNEYM